MGNQKMYVAIDRSIVGPTQNVRWISSGTGRKSKLGDAGRRYLGGVELPSELVDYLKSTKDTNGSTKLENMLRDGYVVFEPNTRSPVSADATPLPVERFVDPNQRRS